MGMSIHFVFHRHGAAIKSLRTAWENACARAGIPGRLPHDFRRTAVRSFERAGVPRSVAMRLTGHRSESVYRRYCIVSQRDLAEGASKLALLREREGASIAG
jgi:integrase